MRKAHLFLTIKSHQRMGNARLHRSEPVAAHRFHAQVKLWLLEDAEAELLGWLKNTCDFSA